MESWLQKGRKYVLLKFANIFALLFWIIYFLDPFLPLHDSVEKIIDFDEFTIEGGIHGGYSTGSSIKKIITPQRNFRAYADENGFFISDTLEIQYTHFFNTVKRYRKISVVDPSDWIENKAWRYRNVAGMMATLVLTILTLYLIF